MSWHLGRMVGFDLETTGTDIETDRIVTACVVTCGAGHDTESLTWLSDVDGMEIPEAASRLHGVDTARARTEGRPAAEVISEVVDALIQAVNIGAPIVAMNAPFDLTLLDRETRRHGIKPLTDVAGDWLHVLDPRVLDKRVDPYRRGKRTLADLCRHYRVTLDGAHSADTDAIAACRVVWRIAQQYAEVGQATLSELHDQQTVWAYQQAASFADYLRRAGHEKEANGVRGEWPLVPAQEVSA